MYADNFVCRGRSRSEKRETGKLYISSCMIMMNHYVVSLVSVVLDKELRRRELSILQYIAMPKKIVKVCGIKSEDAANTAIVSGASLLGTILVPNRARTVDAETARRISKMCYEKRVEKKSRFISSKELLQHARALEATGPRWFEEVCEAITENGPYLVGVFRNQPLEDVVRISEELGVDVVQLHGSEDVDVFVAAMELPVIPRFVLSKPGIQNALSTHKFLLPLFDSEQGGEGKLVDWEDAARFGADLNGRYILAGGLTPENVGAALTVEGCYGVDVSGGVETEGHKDKAKIQAFVEKANQAAVTAAIV